MLNPLTESECDIFKDFRVSDDFVKRTSEIMHYFLNRWYRESEDGDKDEIDLPKDAAYLIGEYVNIGKFSIDDYYEECLSFIKIYFAKLSDEKNQTVSIYVVNTLNTKDVENVIRRIGKRYRY